MGIIELTVPSDNRIRVSNEMNKTRYSPAPEEA